MKKQKSCKRALSLLVSVIMLVGVIPSTVLASSFLPDDDDGLRYVDENGEIQIYEGKYTVVDEAYNSCEFSSEDDSKAWYLLKLSENYYGSLTFTERIEIKGDVVFVLDPYLQLNLPKGIHVGPDSSLTISSPKSETDSYSGSISISPTYSNGQYLSIDDGYAAIGGNPNETNGDITINGGGVSICGGIGGACIGSGGKMNGSAFDENAEGLLSYYDGTGTIKINYASVTCPYNGDTNTYAAVIGGGYRSNAPEILLSHVSFMGLIATDGAVVGAGPHGRCDDITVKGVLGSSQISAINYGSGSAFGDSVSPSSDVSFVRSILFQDFCRIETISQEGEKVIRIESGDDFSVYDSAMVLVGNNDLRKTNDISECLNHSHVTIRICQHENAVYERTDNGHTMVCDNCRVQFQEETHEFENGVCSVCGYHAEAVLQSATVIFEGELKLRFGFSFSEDLLEDTEAYVQFENTVSGNKVTQKIADVAGNGNYVYFDYAFLLPEFAQMIKVRVFHDGGEVASFFTGHGVDCTETGFSYSAYKYTSKMRNIGPSASSSKKMADLALALQTYGLSAAQYFGLDMPTTIDGAYYDITEEMLAPYKHVVQEGSQKPDGVRVFINLFFEEDHTLRFTYELPQGKTKDDYTFMLDGTEVTPFACGENRYGIEVENISAVDMANMHSFTISDGIKTYTVDACALSYAWTSVRNGSEHRVILGQEMYLYYKAAIAFFLPEDAAA